MKEEKVTVADVRESMRPPKEGDPSVGVATHKEDPYVEVRVNSTWAASYVNGEIASAIRLFHQPEFIVDLMVNSTHEAVKAAGKAWQGTAATNIRKELENIVAKQKGKAKPDKGEK